MLVLIVIYGIAPKIQEEKRPLLYIGAGITFILIVINIAIGFYIKDKYCKKNEIEASETGRRRATQEAIRGVNPVQPMGKLNSEIRRKMLSFSVLLSVCTVPFLLTL